MSMPELERVGGDDRQQLAADEPRLDLAALLRRVAGAVRRDAVGELGLLGSSRSATIFATSSTALRDLMKQIVRAPPRTSSASRSAASPSALRRVCSASSRTGGFHIAIWRRAPGEPSRSTSATSSRPGQPLGQLDGVGDRRAGEQEARLGAVGGGDAPQPPQHVGDVRAEHAAVDVGLVDDDDREVGEEVAPRPVVGQDPDVEHVGVGEDEVRAPADRRALLAAACRRRRSPGAPACPARTRAAPAPGPGPAPSSGTGTARGRVGSRQQHVQRRQVEAQRFPRRRAGRDDRRAPPRPPRSASA